jgi:hypothetical protein
VGCPRPSLGDGNRFGARMHRESRSRTVGVVDGCTSRGGPGGLTLPTPSIRDIAIVRPPIKSCYDDLANCCVIETSPTLGSGTAIRSWSRPQRHWSSSPDRHGARPLGAGSGRRRTSASRPCSRMSRTSASRSFRSGGLPEGFARRSGSQRRRDARPGRWD